MKDIILITKEPIIKHIFKLLSVKNSLDFEIFDDFLEDLPNSKAIIIDGEEFFSNALRSISNNIILITDKNLEDISRYSLVIKKPFLPINFEKEIISFLSNIKNSDQQKRLKETSNDLEQEKIALSDDELDNGGILDKKELNKLQDILNNDEQEDLIYKKEDIVEDDQSNLETLSSIIDNAIEELNSEQEVDKNDLNYTIILDNFSMNELKPLFSKLNKKLIEELKANKKLNLTLRIEK